eukprot:1404063-Ditylum_brightwellii.AAC.1
MICDFDRAVKQIVRLYDFYLDNHNKDRRIRRAVRARKKKAEGPRMMVLKYGVEVPQSVKHAI